MMSEAVVGRLKKWLFHSRLWFTKAEFIVMCIQGEIDCKNRGSKKHPSNQVAFRIICIMWLVYWIIVTHFYLQNECLSIEAPQQSTPILIV